MLLFAILCMMNSVTMAGRLAYWRFEQGPVGAPVPKTVGGFVFEPSVPDSSGNGNELSVWDQSAGGYVFRSQVAFGTVALTGAANQFSVKKLRQHTRYVYGYPRSDQLHHAFGVYH